MNGLVPVKITSSIGTITDNLDAVEASIMEKAEEYKRTVVTEDTINEGRKLLADIRKEKNSLDNERKAIKKAWLEPYDNFEKRVKRIIGLYDGPVEVIDSQLKEYDRQRREEKRAEIGNIYNIVKGDMEEWLPLEKIYNPKWENASYSNKKIREDMEALFGQMEISVSTIKSVSSEFEEEGLAVLKSTGDLAAAFKEMDNRKRIKEEIIAKEERKRQEEEQKKTGTEEAGKVSEEPGSTIMQQPELQVQRTQQAGFKEPVQETDMPFAPEKEIVIRVHIRESSLGWFKKLMEEKFIRYEVI